MTRTAKTIYLVIRFEYANHFDQPLFEYQKVLQTYYISILFELSALNFLSIILRQIISAKLARKETTFVYRTKVVSFGRNKSLAGFVKCPPGVKYCFASERRHLYVRSVAVGTF